MDIILIALRLIHILAGIFWAGGGITAAAFITPSARVLGPDGGKFMQQLLRQKFSMWMGIASILTVLAGIALYWRASLGFQIAWMIAPSGLTLTIGALAGLIASGEGQFIIAPTTARMQALAKEMQAASGPPKPEQIAEMEKLQMRLGQAGVRSAILLVISVVGMAIARYM